MNFTQPVRMSDQDVSVTVGPFQWPNLNIPLIPKVRGKVKVEDIESPVKSPICIEYAIKILHDPNLPTIGDAPISNCVDPSEEPHFEFIDADLNPPSPKKGDRVI